jgi:eukaryotic-like serine/threonine-protein kinase
VLGPDDRENLRTDSEATLRETTSTRSDTSSTRTHAADMTAGATSVSRVGPTVSATLLSPLQALHLEEIRRIRAFSWLAAGFAAAVALALPFTERHPITLAVMLSGFIVYVPAALWLHKELENAHELPMRTVVVFGLTCVYAGTTGIYYFGLLSPAAAAIAFGIFFFSPSTSFRAALAIYLASAGLHALLAAATLSGAVADRGLMSTAELGEKETLLIHGVVQVVFLASFVIGRATRRATLSAIHAHGEAMQQLEQRENLLAEARIELDEARGLGKLGHYSDQQLGSFVLGEVIGRGAMGEVYEAMHIATGDPAAVKLLHHQALGEAEYLRRFIREARTAAQLDSPHVCRVLEVGGLDAPVPYIAMELLKGEDLAELLRKRPRLPLREVVKLVTQIGRGLDAAREAGIVHRDINPRNLFAAVSGSTRTWKILDFGVAKAESQDLSLTQDEVVGTPAYMAPELAMGRPVSYRADLFSLGAVAYRALTGRAAFSGSAVSETLMRVVHDMPPRPSELVRVPQSVDDVMAVALAKAPEQRFESASALARALERAARGKLDLDLRERAEQLLAIVPWRARVA